MQSGATLTLSGSISDGAASNGMVVLGGGTLAIAGANPNTYSGDTVIGNQQSGNSVVVDVQKSQGLGSGGVSVATGAALQLQGNVTLANAMLSLSGSGSAVAPHCKTSAATTFGTAISRSPTAPCRVPTEQYNAYSPVNTSIISGTPLAR